MPYTVRPISACAAATPRAPDAVGDPVTLPSAGVRTLDGKLNSVLYPKVQGSGYLVESLVACRRVAIRFVLLDLLLLQLQAPCKRSLAEAPCNPGLGQTIRELFERACWCCRGRSGSRARWLNTGVPEFACGSPALEVSSDPYFCEVGRQPDLRSCALSRYSGYWFSEHLRRGATNGGRA